MFKDATLEKIFAHKEMQKIPVGMQTTSIHVFEEILEDILEVNPETRIRELMA